MASEGAVGFKRDSVDTAGSSIQGRALLAGGLPGVSSGLMGIVGFSGGLVGRRTALKLELLLNHATLILVKEHGSAVLVFV